ncbi:MAG: tetratricopeptide repeat protein [Pseudomonadota bacterium]
MVLTGAFSCTTSDFRSAEEMLRHRKFYNAIELYLSFVRDHPDHRRATEALFQVANIEQMMLNDPAKALVTYRKLVSAFPVSEYTILAQRRVADLQKNHFANFHQAIVEYEKLIKIVPNHADAPAFQLEVARCYTLLHNFDQAAIEYQTLLKKHPNYDKLDEAYFEMANNAYIAGKYDRAIAAYEAVSAKYPKSLLRVQAIFGAASSYEEIDDIDNARRRYKEIEKEYPSPKVVAIRLAGLEKRERMRNKPGVPIK